MELASRQPPSYWQSLLWKDVRQVRSVAIAVVAALLGVQTILLLLFLFGPADQQVSLLHMMVSCGFIAPVLFVLGAGGMLIGHERQVGSWNWSSSLPLGWRSAMGSKLLVSLLGCVVVTAALAVLPAALAVLRPGVVQLGLPAAWDLYSAIPLLAMLEIVVVFYTAALLFRDTLSSLAIAGVGLVVFHLFAIPLCVWLFRPLLSRAGLQPVELEGIVFAIQIVAVSLLGGVVFALAFRWRWGAGQQAMLLPGWAKPARANRAWARIDMLSWSRPGSFISLLRIALGNLFWTRIVVSLGMFLVAFGFGGSHSPDAGWHWTMLGVAAAILGTTAFAGDQVNSRFRFLADRGVPPGQVCWSRLLVPLAFFGLLAAVFAVRSVGDARLGVPGVILLGGLCWGWLLLSYSPVYLVAAYSSLCFRNATIAMVVTVVTCIVGSLILYCASLPAMALGELGLTSVDYVRWGSGVVVVFSWVGGLVLLLAVRRGVTKWLWFREPGIAAWYPAVCGVAVCLPIFLGATLGFLVTPKVEWKGVPLVSIDTGSPMLPPLRQVEVVLAELDAIQLVSSGTDRAYLLASLAQAEDAVLEYGQEAPRDGLRLMAGFVAELDRVLDAQPVQVDEVDGYYSHLGGLLRETASIARLAGSFGDAELARQAWACNRKLRTVGGAAGWIATRPERELAHDLWATQTDEQLAALADDSLAVPPPAQDPYAAEMSWLFSSQIATLARESLRGNVTRYPPGRYYRGVRELDSHSYSLELLPLHYPPLRWKLERDIAKALSDGELFY